MNSLSELYSRLNKYYSLRGSIDSIISFFDRSIENIEPATAIANYYSVDSNSADLSKVISSKEKIKSKRSFLSNSVIPTIDNQIINVKRQIEAEIERQRREAEEAMAARLIL